ncbi:hypothetical protein [Companilactobacillus bobalius]|uniref:hypothetical protein n=1 Tax=Companilactobacillus bobalius TaxID=2801451 RepID=UPI001F180906|nr:hypothetical protein [Companilactobacillus bobalius]
MKYITFNHQNTSAIGIGKIKHTKGNQAQTERKQQTKRFGLDHGINLIDTAEMYGEGFM